MASRYYAHSLKKSTYKGESVVSALKVALGLGNHRLPQAVVAGGVLPFAPQRRALRRHVQGGLPIDPDAQGVLALEHPGAADQSLPGQEEGDV